MKRCDQTQRVASHGARKLSDLKEGSSCLIAGFCGCEKSACELQRMGLVAGELVRVIRTGSCMLVECGGFQMALRSEMGRMVEVLDWNDASVA